MHQRNYSTFLRYPGGKSKPQARNQIKKYFPQSFGEFREPFLGGGGLFFSIDPSIPRWINDLNQPLIAVYEALKGRPKEFIELCQAIAPATENEAQFTKRSGVQYPQRLWDQFYSLLDDQEADPALRYLFLNRCSLFGRVILDPSRRNRTTFTNPDGWSHGLFERLEQASEILKNTKITCSDYEWLLTEPGDDVLVFADPPYMVETELPKCAKLYEHSFKWEDHVRLRDAIIRSNHKVILSYDDHPEIWKLYSGLHKDIFIHEAQWTYVGRMDRKIGRELVITNYPLLELGRLPVEETKTCAHFQGNIPTHPPTPTILPAA